MLKTIHSQVVYKSMFYIRSFSTYIMRYELSFFVISILLSCVVLIEVFLGSYHWNLITYKILQPQSSRELNKQTEWSGIPDNTSLEELE